MMNNGLLVQTLLLVTSVILLDCVLVVSSRTSSDSEHRRLHVHPRRSAAPSGHPRDDGSKLARTATKTSCVRCTESPGLTIAVLAPNNDSLPYSLNKILPAIIYSVQSIEADANFAALTRERTIDILYQDTDCSSTLGPLGAFDFYINHGVNVFLGPLCPYVLAPVARYSTIWDIPLLTSGGQIDNFDFKQPHYRLLTRMNGAYSQVGNILLQILRKFHWHMVGLLYHNFDDRTKGNSNCYFTLSAVFSKLGTRPYHKGFDEMSPHIDYKALLKEISLSARIIVMCASSDSIRSIMMAAEELGMVASGEYVFFNIEIFVSENERLKPWHRPQDTKENNERAKRAYEALLLVSARVPETAEYLTFSREVKKIAREKLQFEYKQGEVNTFVTAFQEAVALYAMALNETISEGYSITNGSIITKKMWNRTFEGISGNVSIDENGDRNLDYSILDMDPITGNFQVVANYYGATKSTVDVANTRIHWAGGRSEPPPDTPDCGFDGSKCLEDVLPHYMIASGVLTVILFVICIGSYQISRHYKLEAELSAMSWKVKWEDILTTQKRGKGKKFGSMMSMNRYSLGSSLSNETVTCADMSKQLFVQTGYYKGSVVAIKAINKSRIDVSRALMLEMKRVKDLQHDHIVRFIGACVEAPFMCLITEYGPRGSLQDILENDQIKLDWMFRYSLMHDIVKGMAYLHASDIRSHGNLKSSNCVVDSRFVLKITDFGLPSLRISDEDDNDNNSYAHWRRKLWTSPELLRQEEPPAEGTPKGDVYSYAIIVQEICFRQGPFYLGQHIDLGPNEIVDNVRRGQSPAFRPTIHGEDHEEEIVQMMTRCWAEDPFDRPDFQALKMIIRKLNKDNESGNILDNLLSRMEQYANNLEALVEERTADYLEEKRKAEDLLYQLLPKSVACDLIRGDSVAAEAYDSVTIYFSDIVGFTSLSAQSTPMQVVALLNDLYTCFDSILENFDVYKIETIGDAYMVVSGVPVSNGYNHAREIARMSLALLNAVLSFTIRHRPAEQLKLRIGLHSGPCAAGVVGLKMPRYCLFGDTVNTASRMESTGLPLRIHLSPRTKEVLDTFSTFKTEPRGEVEMKGKGKMATYWLLGEMDKAGNMISSVPFPPNLDETKLTNM